MGELTLSDVLRALKTERVFDYGYWGEVTIRILIKAFIRRVGCVLVVVALSLIVSIGLCCLLLLAPLVAAPHSLYFYWTEALGLFLWGNILFNYCMAAFTSPGHPGDAARLPSYSSAYSTSGRAMNISGGSGSISGSGGRAVAPSPHAHALTLAINRGTWADLEGLPGRAHAVSSGSSSSNSRGHDNGSNSSSCSGSNIGQLASYPHGQSWEKPPPQSYMEGGRRGEEEEGSKGAEGWESDVYGGDRIDGGDGRDERDGCEGGEGSWRECKKCEAPKPPRCHHCSVCGQCVLRMDHHW